MYVNEQMTTREKEKALNELRALIMPIYTINLKHRSQKRKTIIGFPCRSQRIEKTKKKESTPVLIRKGKRCEVADGVCSNLQIALVRNSL
jgi:hypothetical protein